MRVYSLANPEYRRTVNLQDFEKDIRRAVKNTNPGLEVVVDEHSYAIPDTVTTGEVIKIGRAIAKSPLGKYCLERPVLFVGARVTCEDIFMDEAMELDDED